MWKIRPLTKKCFLKKSKNVYSIVWFAQQELDLHMHIFKMYFNTILEKAFVMCFFKKFSLLIKAPMHSFK